jgi:Family of unknown function (DUF6559)
MAEQQIEIMFRLIKRRKAIKNFIFRLSLDLQRRFDQKTFYSIEEIDRALEGNKHDKAFKAYAYALFCSRVSFDNYFNQLNVNCTYDGLRKFVAKKFFRGIIDFNAAAIVRFAKGVGDGTYRESDLGSYSGDSGHSGDH